MTKKLAKSPWLLHYDGSSCNGCDIEVLACTTPKYDIERFGIINTGDPFQADILLITGGVNHQSEDVIRQIYTQMPEPKVVVAVGICACTGGVFKDCYNIKGGVDTVIPVDVYVPGCAARPQAIIDGVVRRWRSCSASGKITPPGAAAARRKKGGQCEWKHAIPLNRWPWPTLCRRCCGSKWTAGGSYRSAPPACPRATS